MPDVVTIGETMLRLSAPAGVALEQTPSLLVHVAGAESNVAVTLCRMGTSAGWISRLADNPLGRRIHNEIRAQGVDVSRVLWTHDDRVGLYFVEPGSTPRPARVVYDRTRSAMAGINPDEVDWSYVRQARAVHLTGITPGLSPSCRHLVTRAIEEAGAAGQTISFDVNYRARLWSAAEAAAVLGPLLRRVGILICTAADAHHLFALDGGAVEVAEALRDQFECEIAVVTDGMHSAATVGRHTYQREGYKVDAIDRIGAGDAFAAGFIHGFLTEGVEQGLTYGAALAALKHTYFGDTAWVSAEDVRALITGEDAWR